MAQRVTREIPAPVLRVPRRRLLREQVLALHLLHVMLLDDIHAGRGTEATLWELVANALTWSHAAQLLGLGEPEIAPQLELAIGLVERWGAEQRVEFRGSEYQVARFGSIVMDKLAEAVDQATATKASDWSEARLAELRQGVTCGSFQ